MALDPISGPIPREEFRALINAPYGEALKVIRKHDPLFGRSEGEKIKWRVQFSRRARETGHATVQAETKEEAERLAEKLDPNSIDWEPDWCSDIGEIEEVEPAS